VLTDGSCESWWVDGERVYLSYPRGEEGKENESLLSGWTVARKPIFISNNKR
jgi:hypothetical protein